MSNYTVQVGNVGQVHEGNNAGEAARIYNRYKALSVAYYGRAAGEPVQMFRNGELFWEHAINPEMEAA